ncbi:Kelch repeat type 1 [Corchorus capsularis]|uniref:Kelch repeat type 1 n=1 Tax=Corchorus capsularis TaxID=210143 RepID=A0A1R3H687_COCAP|nr:Kelch repeat type 1 [Corchorus capsularis]
MPPEVLYCSAAVACSNQIYVLGGVCKLDTTCPDKVYGIHSHNSVFYFDGNNPEKGWSDVPPMQLGRAFHSAVTLGSKIYVFGGSSTSPEYLDINDLKSSWKLLPEPPLEDMSYPVVDSANHRILVHFKSNDSLYALNVDDNNWCLLKDDFGGWPDSESSVIVDNVLYSLSPYGAPGFFFFPQSDQISFFLRAHGLGGNETSSLVAYDLAENKRLPTRWLSRFQGYAPSTAYLVHTGGSNLCVVWHSVASNTLEYIKFCVTRDSSGEVHARDSESETQVSESETWLPIEAKKLQIDDSVIDANVCQISLL